MLGLGLSLTTGGVATPAYVVLAKAFVSRVEADGGTVDSFACLKTDMAYLTSNPDAPAGYTVEWTNATVGSSAEFRINLVGGAGYTYTYAVTDTQATEVTGTGVMGGNIQAVTADLSTLVDGTVTLAVYLTGAGGDGNVVTDTANLVGYTGLLDTYSGAAAAYSLRLLDTSYTGDAIVVRRASDNTTQSIGFVNNELDTATLESFCSGTDGFVTTWYDQSGNGNDVIQASASSQPKIVSSGSAILENGKAAIQWDGVDDELNFSGDISATEVSSIIVAKAITNGINNRFFGWRNSSFSFLSVLVQLGTSTSLRGISQTNDTTQELLYTGVDYTNNSLISMYNASIWRINGNEFTSADSGGSTGVRSTNGLALGSRGDGGNDGNVQFQEAIFYASDESTNRIGIETNINDFYTIY